MRMTFVKYRTNNVGGIHIRTKYAVVPTIWLSDFLQWLSDIEVDVLETTDNFDHEARLPINWPSYETCSYGIIVSDAIHCVL